MSGTPFHIGQRWVLRSRPEVRATVHMTLSSRGRRHREAWATTDERYDGLPYPFAADDPTRSRDILVNVDDWRAPDEGRPEPQPALTMPTWEGRTP